MSEKVLHEIRVIETEDGFRIELKGDKEHLREIVEQFMGEQQGYADKPGWHPGKRALWKLRRMKMKMMNHRHHGRHFGHHAPPHMHPGYDLGPWFDEGDEPGEDMPRRF